MHLSETVEWGLHACLALAMLPNEARVPARYLAEYHGLKPSYLSKAMHKLASAGIVLSVEGRSGGLALARSAENISMLEIVEALEGSSSFFRCTEIRRQGPCAAARKHYRAPCTIARVMHQADAAWRRVLASTSLQDLRQAVAVEPIAGVVEATQKWIERTGAVR
jgi:Rrf2 family protein